MPRCEILSYKGLALLGWARSNSFAFLNKHTAHCFSPSQAIRSGLQGL